MNTLNKLYNFILLPGLDGTGKSYTWLKREMLASGVLPDNIYVIPYDNDFYYDDLVEKIRPIIFNSKLPNFIIAESYAGPLALELATEYPAKVEKMAISGSFGIRPDCHIIPSLGMELFKFYPKSLIPLNKIPHFLMNDMLMNGFGNPELNSVMAEIYSNSNSNIIDKRIKEIVNLPLKWREKWSKPINQPTLILKPLKDRLVNKNNSNILHENLPNSFVVELNAPHLLLQTHAPEAWKSIVKFSNIDV